MSNRSGVKHGVRWDGWVAVPKRVPSPRGLGGLVQLDIEQTNKLKLLT